MTIEEKLDKIIELLLVIKNQISAPKEDWCTGKLRGSSYPRIELDDVTFTARPWRNVGEGR